jgi:hypothetical protein
MRRSIMTASRITRELALAVEERLLDLDEDEITLPGVGTLTYLGAAYPEREDPGLPLYWRDPAGQVWDVTVTVTARPADSARLPAAVLRQVTA